MAETMNSCQTKTEDVRLDKFWRNEKIKKVVLPDFTETNNKINNEIILKNKKEKKKCTLSKILIANFIIILIIALISLIILFIYKSKKNKKNEVISTIGLSYSDAENLLGSEIIGDNHNLLSESLNSIEDSLAICENSTFKINKINSEISFSPPEYLNEPTSESLKLAKEDIELYNKKYEELSYKTNNITQTTTQSIKNISTSLKDIKEEVNIIKNQFEETIKNLCLPLVLEQKGLSEIKGTTIEKSNKRKLYSVDKVVEYKNETEKLNELYNRLFIYIQIKVKIIADEIIEIPNIIMEIHNIIEKGLLEYEDILKQIEEEENSENLHSNLLLGKGSFVSIKDNLSEKQKELEERIKNFENKYEENKFDFDEFKIECDRIILNLKNISNLIKEEIIDIREKNYESPIEISELNASSLIADSIIKTIDKSFQIILYVERETEKGIESIIVVIDVEIKTSLDLLFVMDMTGSMGGYIEQAKANIISIMERIINECPGIDINLGFIGYRDILDGMDKYISIDFTKDYQELKNSIQNVSADGGGDSPEDVAWAMEQALDKDWKSNARFLVYVADCPYHGTKYNNYSIWDDEYPDGFPGRKNLDDLIKGLAENNISLYCIKITEDTNKMFAVFEDIYNNYIKCQFKIVPIENEYNFSEVVIENAVTIYKKQRNNEIL